MPDPKQTIQKIHSNAAEATDDAIALSKEHRCSVTIVLSRHKYYVETGVPFIRVWEQVVAIYDNGKLRGNK